MIKYQGNYKITVKYDKITDKYDKLADKYIMK